MHAFVDMFVASITAVVVQITESRSRHAVVTCATEFVLIDGTCVIDADVFRSSQLMST